LTRFGAGRDGAALVLSQSLCDAFLDRLVLRPQRHLIVLRVLFGRSLSPASALP
jgi:hypothetical protein